MALFSNAQANGSTIVRMEKRTRNGSHEAWVFGVTDSDGNYYDWEDTSLNPNASKTQVKTRIKDYLKGNGSFDGVEKRSAPDTVTWSSITDKGLDETIG
jgi:phosphatidate phosphatase APP1